MVSQRQKEARKSFKAANPGLFPKPEPTPPKDPTKKKKSKQTNYKRKKNKLGGVSSSDLNKKPIIKGFRKHPLRVPGMKPGESCFICKAKTHIAKLCPEKAQWEKNKICLLCRSRGHSLKNCPSKNDKSVDKKLCYNCGESGHSLDKCPQPLQDGGTKFASCFICNEIGHLSKNCPQNTHGIYPKVKNFSALVKWQTLLGVVVAKFAAVLHIWQKTVPTKERKILPVLVNLVVHFQ